MFKKLVIEWLGITDKVDPRYITRKEVREILATELKAILTESVTGEALEGNIFTMVFSAEAKNVLFGVLNRQAKTQARKTAEIYVRGLAAELLAKVNSEQFLDEIVKRINNKQVG